jgi:hypothetical protein
MRFIGNSADRASIVSASLTYPGVISSANRFENVHNRLTENIDNSISGPFAAYRDGLGNIGADGTTLYISVLLRQHPDPQVVNPNSVPVYDAFELWRGDSSPSGTDGNRKVSIDLWTGHPTSTANWYGTAWQPTNNAVSQAPLIGTDTNTHLFVLKMMFGAGDNDVVSIYADPSGTSEPLTASGIISSTDLSFDRLGTSIFSGQDNALTADEIRIGSSFTDVVPEPCGTVIVALAAAGMLRRGRGRMD